MSRLGQVMQAYWVEVAANKIGRAKPGQFVHTNAQDDRVCGFIGQVDQPGKRVMIYLFEPVPVKPFATVERDQVPDGEWMAKLNEILVADPKMKANWQAVINNGVARN